MLQRIKQTVRIVAQVYVGDSKFSTHVFRDARGRYQTGSKGQYVAHYAITRNRVNGRFVSCAVAGKG